MNLTFLHPVKKIFALALVVLILGFSALTNSNDDSSIKTIKSNITSGLLSGSIEPFAQADLLSGDEIISRIAYGEDGNAYFSDVDYSNTDRVSWLPALHIRRTERLAILYRLCENDEVRGQYKTHILKLLDYWIKKDYQNSNWWQNQLFCSNILGEIGILMKDDLSKNQLRDLSEMVGRGCFTVDPTLLYYSGANAIDLSMSSIKFGVLSGSKNAIKTAVSVASKELKYSNSEGIKKDGSFFQHGNMLYMGGYGIDFIRGMTKLISFLSGTDYIFSEKQLAPFASFIVDGMKAMSFGNVLDPTTMGRSISRVNAQPLPSLVPSLSVLANTKEMPRRAEIAQYVDSIVNNKKSNYGLKYFDEGKLLVINNSDFYFSFRGGDNKLLYAERINDENILGYNYSYPGVTTVMSSGREYVDIAPLFDYSLVPGTTAVYESDSQLASHKDYSLRTLKGTYGSKTSNGAAVVFAKTTHEGIGMTVSCFATDNAVVLLGAGMKDSQGRAMNTAINQTFSSGAVLQNGNTVVHGGIKYTVLDGGKLTAKSEHKTGDWRRNNLSYPSIYSEGDIFTISLENKGSYAYSLMSEGTNAEFKVIVNSEKLQAVELPDGRIAASFFEKGSFNHAGREFSGKAGQAVIFE